MARDIGKLLQSVCNVVTNKCQTDTDIWRGRIKENCLDTYYGKKVVPEVKLGVVKVSR